MDCPDCLRSHELAAELVTRSPAPEVYELQREAGARLLAAGALEYPGYHLLVPQQALDPCTYELCPSYVR